MLTILVVEDNRESLKILRGILEDDGHIVLTTENKEDAITSVSCHAQDIDLTILDLWIPEKLGEPPDEENGFAVLKSIKENHPNIDVIILTAFEDVKLAVRGIKAGAYDFLTKPLKLEILRDRLEKIARFIENERKILEFTRKYKFKNILGRNKGMVKVLSKVEKIADSDLPILIVGETGTGKELIARAIHEESQRKGGPFVPVNCGAVPGELLESTFFGHLKGAFTSAYTDRIGIFEQANNGTLFLDEIGEMRPELQVKLLRVLEERKITRVGGNKEIPVNVRIVSATSKKIAEMVGQGTFREDMFQRLKGMEICLPPLRERKDDIPLLAKHFVDEYCRESNISKKDLTREAIEKLLSYDWPGNIRELKQLLTKTVVLNREKAVINAADIIFDRQNTKNREIESLFFKPLKDAKQEFEKRYLENVLRVSKAHAESAKLADIDASNFSKLLKKYKLG